MLALLRLVTNPQVMSGIPFTHDEAWNIYRTYRNLPIIRFLPESDTLETIFAALSMDSILPHHSGRMPISRPSPFPRVGVWFPSTRISCAFPSSTCCS
jgi:hypothetical protein